MSDDLPLDAFLHHVSERAYGPALRLAGEVADDVGIDACVTGLLAAAQQEVGRRWEFGEWTVAQEHAATAVVDAVVAYLHVSLDERVPAAAPHLVLVCAEGDWHVTPARMAAVRLLDRGWRVTYLGGSMPSHHLHRSVAALRPDALGVSCTVPVHLPGARRTVEVGRAHDLPVVAGGLAFGDGPRRARSIGADAGGAPLEELEPRVRALLDGGWSARAPDAYHADEVGALRRFAPSLVDAVLASFTPPAGTPDAAVWVQRTREDLEWIVRFVEVSLDVDDATVLRDVLSWLQGVLVVRGVPIELLAAALARLADAVPDTLPTVQDALLAGCYWVTQGVWPGSAGYPGW